MSKRIASDWLSMHSATGSCGIVWTEVDLDRNLDRPVDRHPRRQWDTCSSDVSGKLDAAPVTCVTLSYGLVDTSKCRRVCEPMG
jgi:hypothetical protein